MAAIMVPLSAEHCVQNISVGLVVARSNYCRFITRKPSWCKGKRMSQMRVPVYEGP